MYIIAAILKDIFLVYCPVVHSVSVFPFVYRRVPNLASSLTFVAKQRREKQVNLCYSQVHNKRGGQNKRGGGFKDFEILINGGGAKISGGGWGQNIKEKRRK